MPCFSSPWYQFVQQKIEALGRPVRITLERAVPDDQDDGVDGGGSVASKSRSRSTTGSPSRGGGEVEAEARAVFARFDRRACGYMESFELAAAVQVLTGAVPSAAAVEAMVAFVSVERYRLSFAQFLRIATSFDFAAHAGGAAATARPARGGRAGKAAAMGQRYELECCGRSLGFRVRCVEKRGALVVSRVLDPNLSTAVSVNDRLLAVNGAPLGFVTNARALNRRVARLPRPLVATFERYDPGRARDDFGRVADGLSNVAAFASVGAAVDLGRVTDVFTAFDASADGRLDVFDLGSAVADLRGTSPPSATVAAMIRFARRASLKPSAAGGAQRPLTSLTLAQFAAVCQAFGPGGSHEPQPTPRSSWGGKDGNGGGGGGGGRNGADDEWWLDTARAVDEGDSLNAASTVGPRGSSSSVPAAAAASFSSAHTVVAGPAALAPGSAHYRGGRVVELSFRSSSLGFKVRGVPQQPPPSLSSIAGGERESFILVVSSVADPALEGIVGVNDRLLAVNGAPLGAMVDHRDVLRRVGSLRRPVRVAFQRYDPNPRKAQPLGGASALGSLTGRGGDRSARGREDRGSQTPEGPELALAFGGGEDGDDLASPLSGHGARHESALASEPITPLEAPGSDASAAVRAAAAARAARRGITTMDQIDLSTIVSMLDGLKVCFGQYARHCVFKA